MCHGLEWRVRLLRIDWAAAEYVTTDQKPAADGRRGRPVSGEELRDQSVQEDPMGAMEPEDGGAELGGTFEVRAAT